MIPTLSNPILFDRGFFTSEKFPYLMVHVLIFLKELILIS